MQRPSLNPSVYLEAAEEAPRAKGPSLAVRCWSVVSWGVKLLFMPIGRRTALPDDREPQPLAARLARGLIYRLAAIPVLLGVIVSVLVYTATHPVPVPTLADPSSVGLYFERVRITAADGVVSEAWLVPVVDARRVLEEKDELLRSRQPAMVLVHDHAYSRQQLLPYLRPFHDAGIVTLTIATRGTSTERPRGRTFGLRESLDVAAAISVLRSRAMTDDDRVGLLGIGTGATAALIAAKADERVKVIAAIDPPRTPEDALAALTPTQRYLRFLQPLSRFTFETVFNVNISDTDLSRLSRSLRDRQVLYVLNDGGTATTQSSFRTVTHFMASRLSDEPGQTSAMNWGRPADEASAMTAAGRLPGAWTKAGPTMAVR